MKAAGYIFIGMIIATFFWALVLNILIDYYDRGKADEYRKSTKRL